MINILTFKARYYNSKIGLNNVLFFKILCYCLLPLNYRLRNLQGLHSNSGVQEEQGSGEGVGSASFDLVTKQQQLQQWVSIRDN